MIHLEVDMIHRRRSVAVLSDGQEIPIVQWISADNQNAEPDDAIACVCGPDFDGNWYAVDLSQFSGMVH